MNNNGGAGAGPPRVKMTYEVQMGDAVSVVELPYVIGVLADLEGQATPTVRLRDKKFVRIDEDNFDAVLQRMAPVLQFSVPCKLDETAGELRVELRFRAMSDFEPAMVAAQIPALQSLLEVRTQLDDLRSAIHANERLDTMIRDALLADAGAAAGNLEQWEREIESIVQLGLLGRLEEQKQRARMLLRAFFRLVSAGETIASPDTEAVITERIGALDDVISLQLNEVFHHPAFQRLEATWRGLHYLVTHGHSSQTLHIELLPVSKRDLLRDLQRAPEFDQSALFKKVYDERYGIYGGSPFSVLIADYEFERSPDDVYLLEQLSYVAAASNAPVIGAAGCWMFGLESFTDLSRPRDLSKIFDSTEYTKWRAFRASYEAQYVGLVMPRILMRLPYGRAGIAVDSFHFDERVGGAEHDRYLWGTAVWAFAVRLAEAFHRYGWCAAIAGPERGGTVPDLPMHEFTSDEGDRISNCPTEIAITDRRRGELEHLGFIPLCYRVGSTLATFFEAVSCKKQGAPYPVPSTWEAAVDLEHLLVSSRFSHYLRAIVRDRERTFLTKNDWEVYLRTWLKRHVLLDDHAPEEIRAQYPLRAADIELVEIPGKPGRYRAVVNLTPHFQLDRQPLHLSFAVEIAGRL